MSRIAYVNGRYVPHSEAAVHVEDRGYQFADGVYEVIHVYGGRFVDDDPHLNRLERSLRELRIDAPMSRQALKTVLAEVVRRNRVREGIVYMQITRGVAKRDHPFPPSPVPPSLVVTARSIPPYREDVDNLGVSAITIPDIRWQRCDIKSVSLLPNVLGKQMAREAGAYEAVQVDAEGYVTEGTSTNFWIVSKDNRLVTRQLSHAILAGITRGSLLGLMESEGVVLDERKFTVDEAREAREAFVTSATSFVKPVVKLDDTVIGNGQPGMLTCKLHSFYTEHVKRLRKIA